VLPEDVLDDVPIEKRLEPLHQMIQDGICAKLQEVRARTRQHEAAGPKTTKCALGNILSTVPGCADMIYCLHGLSYGGNEKKRRKYFALVPEADMAPIGGLEEFQCNTLNLSLAAKEDLNDIVLEVAGLKLAVDTCHGFLRIAMLE